MIGSALKAHLWIVEAGTISDACQLLNSCFQMPKFQIRSRNHGLVFSCPEEEHDTLIECLLYIIGHRKILENNGKWKETYL